MSKISFCLLDCYPENNIRMCKDTAGGYGTGNNFGKTLLSKILNIFTQSQIHQPQMHVGYLLRILKIIIQIFPIQMIKTLKKLRMLIS